MCALCVSDSRATITRMSTATPGVETSSVRDEPRSKLRSNVTYEWWCHESVCSGSHDVGVARRASVAGKRCEVARVHAQGRARTDRHRLSLEGGRGAGAD